MVAIFELTSTGITWKEAWLLGGYQGVSNKKFNGFIL